MQRKLFHAFGMVGFAALLALNLASCAGSKAAALPIASDLVPTENGWSFANYPSSAFPDVQFDTVDMLAMFGNDTNVCIDGIADPCILTAEAATWAQMVNQSRASGSCMGLAVLAAQRFNDNVSPVTATLGSDESTLRAVARAFATQFLSEAQAESEKWLQSSLSDIVKTVKASLAENKVDYTLGLFGPNGGHAVTPFAVEYPSDGVARLMVYDSNWPGRNRYVDVNSEADTWTFSYSSDTPETDPEPWVGGRGDMDLTPIRFEKLTCPFCATDVEVKNTSFLIRTDDPEFSLETEAGVITQDGTALPEGASVLKVKGAVGTRTYDYIVKLPQRELSAANTRNELRVKGNASVFAMIPSGIAQFQTSAKMVSPVVFTDNSVSTTDPTISLKVASKNLVASVSGSSTSLTLEGNALSVAVTLPGGEIVQQRVDESQPALLSEVNPSTGEVVVLQASESGQVTRTEIATDGTRTENISAEKLDLVSVVPVLPPTLESVANPALPAPADRDLNNPSYKADAAYVAPVATSQAPQSDPTPTTEALRSTATADTAPTSTIPLAATADTTPNTIREVTTTVSPATTATTTTTLPRTTITTTTTTTLPRTTITTTTTLPRTTTTLPRTTITTTTTLPRTTTTLPRTTTTTVRRATITTTTTVPPTTTTTTVPPTTTTTTVPPTTTTTTTIPLPTYTVTYNGNSNTGGSVPSSRTSSSSFTVAANSGELVRTGYSFASWNTAANGSGTTYTAGSSTLSMTASTTLYAQWTAATLTVTTDEQSGSAIDSVSTTTGGTISSSPGTPTRSGYTFNGWFTASSGGSALTFPYTHNQTANFTLYAQWTANTLTVTTDEQSGSAIDSVSTTTGGTISSSPGTPTRSGYTFNGWFTASTGGSALSFPYAHNQTANFTLYAQWTAAGPTCAAGGACAVGDTGPGGGVVFYVAGANFTSTGSDCATACRYLEAAPTDQSTGVAWATSAAACYADGSDSGTNDCENYSIYSNTSGQAASRTAGEGIGMGMANTNQIYDRLTFAGSALTSAYAAGIAWAYTNNGKSDWHLPSRNELNELRQQAESVGGFVATEYWSSSEYYGRYYASAQTFLGQAQFFQVKGVTFRVRPVRAFGPSCAAGGACVVGDTGPGGGIVFYVHDDADDLFTSTGSDCGTSCKYMEAAPTDHSTRLAWCDNQTTNLGVAAQGIGSGMSNTTTADGTCTSGAIQTAADYSNNGKTDWHLPSKNELNELCKYARTQAFGANCTNEIAGSHRAGFSFDDFYWSSSDNPERGDDAYAQYFINGGWNTASRWDLYYVRLIRAFG